VSVIITIIIIIIIIITTTTTTTTIISFMQGIYTYIPETNHVPKEYNVAAILSVLFMAPIPLVPALALIHLLLLLLLLIAVQFSLRGSSPYTSTEEINENKYT
jgi:hypothetical protein